MEIYFSINPPNLDVKIDYSVESSLKSFKEEVLETLYSHHKNYKIERLLLSDGMDSRFIALCLKELGISFKSLSFVFSKTSNSITERITAFTKKIGVTSSFFVMEKENLCKHVEYLTYEKKIAYPIANGYYLDYLVNTYEENFFSGASVEFKYRNNEYVDVVMVGPNLVRKNNPNRLFGFANSRTFLSYINNPKFLATYKIDRESLPRKDDWYIRDLIYTDIFPDLDVVLKGGHWYDGDFRYRFDNHLLIEAKKEVPWVFQLKNYRFYVQEYFKTLKNNPSVVQPG